MFPTLNAGRLPDFTQNKSPPPLQSSVAQIPVERFKLAAGKRTGAGRLVVERRRQIADKSTLCRLQRRLPHGRKPWPPSECTHPSSPVPSPTQPPLRVSSQPGIWHLPPIILLNLQGQRFHPLHRERSSPYTHDESLETTEPTHLTTWLKSCPARSRK